MGVPLNIDWQQILLHMFNFVLLTGGLYILLFKPVKSFMEKRQAGYEKQKAEAAEAVRAAEVRDAEVSRREGELAAELEDMQNAARKKAEAEREAAEAAARGEAEKIIADARTQAELQRQRIIAEANKEAVSIAREAIDKLFNERFPREEPEDRQNERTDS